jgi:hypothetical protein
MKKIKCFTLIILTALLFTGCFKIDPEAERQMKELVEKESKNFISQAKKQYGDNVKVKEIKAEERIIHDTVWIGGTIYAGNNLLGVINIKSEKFNAIYSPQDNIIISDRNYEKITQSAIDDLESSKLNILDLQIRDSVKGIPMLTDDITTYEKALDNKSQIIIRVITDSDISKLELTDFNKIFKIMKKYGKEDPNMLQVNIIEVNDVKEINTLSKRWNSTERDFYGYIKYFCEYQGELERDIEEYNIVAAMNVKYDFDETIEYINIDGKEINY